MTEGITLGLEACLEAPHDLVEHLRVGAASTVERGHEQQTAASAPGLGIAPDDQRLERRAVGGAAELDRPREVRLLQGVGQVGQTSLGREAGAREQEHRADRGDHGDRRLAAATARIRRDGRTG